MKPAIIISLVFVSLITTGQSPNISWQKSIGGINTDNAIAVCNAPDSNIIMIGNLRDNSTLPDLDIYLAKFSLTGQLIWSKTLGGSVSDYAQCITTCSSGGYVLLGYTSSNDGNVSGLHGHS